MDGMNPGLINLKRIDSTYLFPSVCIDIWTAGAKRMYHEVRLNLQINVRTSMKHLPRYFDDIISTEPLNWEGRQLNNRFIEHKMVQSCLDKSGGLDPDSFIDYLLPKLSLRLPGRSDLLDQDYSRQYSCHFWHQMLRNWSEKSWRKGVTDCPLPRKSGIGACHRLLLLHLLVNGWKWLPIISHDDSSIVTHWTAQEWLSNPPSCLPKELKHAT